MARPRGFRSSGVKRQVNWVGLADQGFITVANATSVLIASFNSDVGSMPRPTVVRSRGSVTIKSNDEADLSIVGAYGVCIVTLDAFTAGTASVPSPFLDADWEGWFVWRSFSYTQLFVGAGANLVQNSIHQEVDSKAMRKMGSNEVLVQVAASQSGAFGISMPLRFLFKLL